MNAIKIFSSEWTSIAIGGAVMLIGAVVDSEVSTIMCGVGGVIYLFSVVAYYFLKGKI